MAISQRSIKDCVVPESHYPPPTHRPPPAHHQAYPNSNAVFVTTEVTTPAYYAGTDRHR